MPKPGDLVWCKVKGKYGVTRYHQPCIVTAINQDILSVVVVGHDKKIGFSPVFDVHLEDFEIIGISFYS